MVERHWMPGQARHDNTAGQARHDNRRLLAAVALVLAASGAFAACPPAGETLASLHEWRQAHWQPARPALALPLLDCLADPDPGLRDGIAFDALQSMMRGKQVPVETVQAMRTRLLAMMRTPDPRGFAPPFAALTLAEVVRVDRIEPFMTPAQRAEIVDAAVAFLSGVTDYRGFDEREGWRHGVAHGADLVLQLAVHPQLERAQAQALLGAVAAQVAPAGGHFYRYGEPDRLAAPVYYLARRGFFTAQEWEQWLAQLTARVKRDAATQADLATRHNVNAFVASLYVASRESGDAKAEEALLPGLRKAVRAL
jgi:hypothetical protein